MRIILRTVLPALLLVTFLSSSALADTKIGTVDLRKLFDNYWKTKTAQTTIGEQRQRMRENILGEIKVAVNAKARADGYSLVLDSAAETVNGTLTVVYTNGENDLTDAILAQLNAGARIDISTPATNTTL